ASTKLTPTGEPGGAHIEKSGDGVAFFSLEMPREQLASRLLSSEARVNMANLRSGQVSSDDWNKLTEAAARLSRVPIWLDDTPAISILDLRAKLRRLQAELRRHPDGPKEIGLVAIDYL